MAVLVFDKNSVHIEFNHPKDLHFFWDYLNYFICLEWHSKLRELSFYNNSLLASKLIWPSSVIQCCC